MDRITTTQVAGSAAFTELCRVIVKLPGLVRVRGYVAGAALSSLRVTASLRDGGELRPYLVDADLDTPSLALPWTSKTSAGTSLFQTPAGGVFEFAFDARAMDLLAVDAKSASTSTVTLEIGQ